MNATVPSGPLTGVRVLDFTHHIAGPACTKLLADYGADVIKIERPGIGDPSRRMGPFPDNIPDREKSGLFLHLNTNKKSITLDLKSEIGRKIAKELAETCEVVVESFSPRVMPNLGLDYVTLSGENSRLVMTSLSSFGKDGPYRDYRSNELIAYALSGQMLSMGSPDREPVRLGATVVQMQAGNIAAVATLGALFAARLYGEGQLVDVSVMETATSSVSGGNSHLVRYAYDGIADPRLTVRWFYVVPTGHFPCADGYVCIHSHIPAEWPKFCEMIERPDLVDDARFSTPEGLMNIVEYGPIVEAALYEWLLQHTKFEVQARGQAIGMPVTAVYSVSDCVAESHLEERAFWQDVKHPGTDVLRSVGAPFQMSETPWRSGSAPLLGQHNAQVYGELGYSQTDLDAFTERGVI